MISKLLAAAICLSALSSCAGYTLGNSKPTELSSINRLSVPLFENKTQEQRIAQIVTNSFVDSITRDGTYTIATAHQSDAEIIASIETIKYSKRRSNRFDSLLASELYLDLQVNWKLVDTTNKTLLSGVSVGRTQFSTSENQQLARTNAIADAAKNASEKITTRIANGF